MLTDPLPTTLDVRKAAARGAVIKGALKPLDLQRFRALLAADEGGIRVVLTLDRDEENRYLVHLHADADVVVICQRCLEPMSRPLACDATLAVVASDEQAAQLPRQLEPLLVEEQECNLWEVVEEELMLALPPFSYHETDACRQTLDDFNAPPPEEPETEKQNPFNVLAQLKAGDDKQE